MREGYTTKRDVSFQFPGKGERARKNGDADFEALISMCGCGRDAHEQDAFSSRVAHRRSALQERVTK